MNTPKNKINRSTYLEGLTTPMIIPPSPQLQNLGYGTGVNVYRVQRSPRMGTIRSPWAVKSVRRTKCSSDEDEVFNQRLTEEAQLLRTLNHPNIVGFRGIKETNDGRCALVMEDCHISLGNILETRNEEKLNSLEADKIKIVCRDVTKALDYLHNVAKLLHGDIKSFNVLIKDDFIVCKLCDFGVSQPLNDDGYLDLIKKPSAEYIGTELWSAPEVFIPNNSVNISCKADIFSFGLVIYECIALIPPHTLAYSEADEESIQSDKSLNETDENVDEESTGFDFEAVVGTRPPLPEVTSLSDEYNIIVELFYLCTNEDPENRPSASHLSKIFPN